MEDLFPLPYLRRAKIKISFILLPLKLYSHGMDWEADSCTERFLPLLSIYKILFSFSWLRQGHHEILQTLLCTCRLHVYNPVCRRRGSLWRYGLCSSEQAHCGFFPFPFKLWGVWNPARHADKEGLYGTQITWVDQTHVCCCSHAPTWALSCLPSAPWSWN